MAKGARASSRKRNNAALRAKVFGPVHDARTERLSAKLQELASKPRPAEEKAMDVDSTFENGKASRGGHIKDVNLLDGMDVDSDENGTRPKRGLHQSRVEKRKKHKKRKTMHRKPKNLIAFPSVKRKRTGPGTVMPRKKPARA